MTHAERQSDDVRDLGYAEYPELPGCFAEAESAVEAIENLDTPSAGPSL